MDQRNIDQNTRTRHRLTTVVAIDICGYSTLAEKDEASAIFLVDKIFDLLTDLTVTHEGSIFHKAGDGVLVEFTSTRGAMDCSIALLSQMNQIPPVRGMKPEVRIGIHVGDVVIKEDGDLMGHCVNIAARLEQNAHPSSILISSHVYNLIGRQYSRLRQLEKNLTLKNHKLPLKVYEFRLSGLVLTKVRSAITKLFVAGIFTIGCIWAVISYDWNSLSERKQIKQITEDSFSQYAGLDISRELDRDYITGVLRDLRGSGIATERVAFTLLKEGRLHDAILVLEEQLASYTAESQDYISTLLEIGALSYQYDPRKAAAAYEAVLIEYPDHLGATIRLGRSFDVLNQPKKAAQYYARALALNPKDYRTKLWLELDIAFNFMLLGQHQDALDILNTLSNISKAKLSKGLLSKIGTERGIVLESLGRLDEAEGQLLEIMPEQAEFGYIYDLARAHNVLGQIAQKRSIEDADNKDVYLKSAINHYKAQLKFDTKLNKQRGIAAANYYLGQTSFELRNLDAANQYFLDGLRLSRQYRIVNIEFLNLLGLAQLETRRTNQAKACAYVQKMQILYNARIDSPIGPLTRERLDQTGCQFEY